MVDQSQLVFLRDASSRVISLPPLTNSEPSKVSFTVSQSTKLTVNYLGCGWWICSEYKFSFLYIIIYSSYLCKYRL